MWHGWCSAHGARAITVLPRCWRSRGTRCCRRSMSEVSRLASVAMTGKAHTLNLNAQRRGVQRQEHSRVGQKPFSIPISGSLGWNCTTLRKSSGRAAVHRRLWEDGRGLRAPTRAIDLASISATSERWCLARMIIGKSKTCAVRARSRHRAAKWHPSSFRPKWRTRSPRRTGCTRCTTQSTSLRYAMSMRLGRAVENETGAKKLQLRRSKSCNRNNQPALSD